MVNSLLDCAENYATGMRKNARSEFGARLLEARTEAGYSQTAAAKAVGMSQAAYGAAETTGQASTKTAQLAALYGVSAEWLATGAGAKTDGGNAPASRETDDLDRALRAIARALTSADRVTRSAIGAALSQLADDPAQLVSVIATVKKLIPAPMLARNPQEAKSPDLNVDLDTSRFVNAKRDRFQGGSR